VCAAVSMSPVSITGGRCLRVTQRRGRLAVYADGISASDAGLGGFDAGSVPSANRLYGYPSPSAASAGGQDGLLSQTSDLIGGMTAHAGGNGDVHIFSPSLSGSY
jgi:hypothetical protein